MERDKKRDLNKHIEFPKEYYAIEVPKQNIARAIREQLKEKDLTYRKAAGLMDDLNFTHFTRVTSGTNYTIDTLLKTLFVLDLELVLKKKS